MKSKNQLPSATLIELMEKQRFGVEYQPIISIESQEIYAYECLSRFFDDKNMAIDPDIVCYSLQIAR
jgi:EAL domain-containing protein (putative c-di-GMP-specific phosphodiesterase class I)